jgi:hypothetical protein
MSMTLKELTARLSAVSSETSETLNRQIRNWTEMGVLGVAGSVNTGTGRSRVYEEEAAYLGAVAVEVARWGMPIGSIRALCTFIIVNLGQPDESITKAIYRGHSDHLLVIYPGAPEDWVNLGYITRRELLELSVKSGGDAKSNSFLVVDLSALWARIR